MRSSQYRASVYYKSHDGKRHQVQRIATTRAQAQADALEAVRERLEGGDGRLSKATLAVDAVRLWLDENTGEGGRLADTTASVYRNAFTRAIACEGSPMAGWTLVYLNDGQRLTNYLSGVAKAHGTGTAKHVKALLSGTLQMAVRFRVLATNEMRQVQGVKSVPAKRGAMRDRTRALSNAEREAFIQAATSWAAVESRIVV